MASPASRASTMSVRVLIAGPSLRRACNVVAGAWNIARSWPQVPSFGVPRQWLAAGEAVFRTVPPGQFFVVQPPAEEVHDAVRPLGVEVQKAGHGVAEEDVAFLQLLQGLLGVEDGGPLAVGRTGLAGPQLGRMLDALGQLPDAGQVGTGLADGPVAHGRKVGRDARPPRDRRPGVRQPPFPRYRKVPVERLAGGGDRVVR